MVGASRSGRLAALLAAGALSGIGLSSCGGADRPPPEAGASPPAPVPPAHADVAPVAIEMKHVRLHVASGIVLAIDRLRGEMISRVPGQPPVFDDQQSYVLQVHTGDVSMDMVSLSHLLDDHLFAYDDAPLSDVSVSADGAELVMKATLSKGIPVKVSTTSSIAPAPGGRIRLHTEKVRAFGVPATGLLDLFHLELDDLVSIEKRRGIRIEGDDILLTPGQVLPPPEMRGHVARAVVEGGRLHLAFAPADGKPPAALTPPQPTAKGYIYFSGSSIRFGKLTMTGSDLQLIDADERDPFEFSPAQYQRQLIAGYSKNTPAGGLETYMPDLDDVPATGRGLVPARPSAGRGGAARPRGAAARP